MVKKILFGVVVLALGVLILFNNMKIFSFDLNIGKIWPVVLIAFGIGELIDAKKLNITSSILLVIGAYFLLYNYSIINISFVKIIVPFLLIMVGLSLLFPIKISKEVAKNTKSDANITSIFADVANSCDSKYFGKATVNTIFGGATLDLSNAKTKEGKSICVATIIFGGLDIILPDDWDINTDGLTCIFGGVEKENRKKITKESKNTLYLTGTVVFGGIEIK